MIFQWCVRRVDRVKYVIYYRFLAEMFGLVVLHNKPFHKNMYNIYLYGVQYVPTLVDQDPHMILIIVVLRYRRGRSVLFFSPMHT